MGREVWDITSFMSGVTKLANTNKKKGMEIQAAFELQFCELTVHKITN